MRQLWFLFSLTILAVGLGSCGSPPEETASTPSPETSPPATPAASPSPQGSPTPTPGQIPPFKDPLVEEKSNVAAGAGLTQSTKPEERLIQLGRRPNGNAVASAPATTPNQGVEDPFGVLPPLIVQRTPEAGEAPEAPEQVALAVPDLPDIPVNEPPPQWRTATVRVPAPRTGTQPSLNPSPRVVPGTGFTPLPKPLPPNLTGNRGNQTTPRNTAPSPRNTAPSPRNTTTRPQPNNSRSIPAQRRPVGPPSLPSLPIAQVPDLPELPTGGTEAPPSWQDPNPPPPPPPPVQPFVPPPPATDLAQAMEVTGVLQVGSQTKVILKAPNEPTSRYVNVGQRVSNGQVLVKRVKFDTGGEPIVIFEQNGVEIAKAVGEVNAPENPTINRIGLTPSRSSSRPS